MRHLLLTLLFICLSLPALVAQEEIEIDGKVLKDAHIDYDGIDVSNYQRDIDWTATAEDKNITFVYIKATEGKTHQQRRYRQNIENARANGVRVGSYHFFRTTSTVQEQFDNFTSMVKKEEQDLVPMIDVETRRGVTGAQLADSVKRFADMLEDYYGCRPIIYTMASYYNDWLRFKLKGYQWFIARYAKTPPKLVDGTKWTLWQFSDRGRIAGIDSYVDLSRFNTGCSVRDITMRHSKSSRRRNHRNVMDEVKEVPPPRKVKVDEKPAVPLSKKQLEQQRKEQEKAAKENKKKAEKAKKEEKKRAEKERKENEKREAERAKQAEKQQKEKQAAIKKNEHDAKVKADAQKQTTAEKKNTTNKGKEPQAANEKKNQAKNNEKAKASSQPKANDKAVKKPAATSANQRHKAQGKRVNQSSSDNED